MNGPNFHLLLCFLIYTSTRSVVAVNLVNQVDNTTCCKDAYDKVSSYEPFLLDLTGSIMYDYFADIKDSYKSICSDYFALNDTLHDSDNSIVKDGAVKDGDSDKKRENHRLHLAIGAALQYCGDPTYNSSLYLFRRYECDDEVKKGSDAIKSFLDDKTDDKLSNACAAQLKALKCRNSNEGSISEHQYIEWVGPWMRLFELIYKSIAATYFEHAVDMPTPCLLALGYVTDNQALFSGALASIFSSTLVLIGAALALNASQLLSFFY